MNLFIIIPQTGEEINKQNEFVSKSLGGKIQ